MATRTAMDGSAGGGRWGGCHAYLVEIAIGFAMVGHSRTKIATTAHRSPRDGKTGCVPANTQTSQTTTMALLPMATNMWKPGSSKPKKSTPHDHQINLPDKISKVGGSAVAVAKKLSSSTMGMRFMQRKKGGNPTESKERNPIASTPNKSSVPGNYAANNEAIDSNSSSVDRKRKCDEFLQNPPPLSLPSGGEVLLDKASVVDMYGLGSDIIGRRSFGGYRKSVMTTWDEALKWRTDDNTRTKNTKHHITDEELLERYEKYVKGRGERESSSSGGSGRKDKRKRN